MKNCDFLQIEMDRSRNIPANKNGTLILEIVKLIHKVKKIVIQSDKRH